jgi:hypothetical protein
MMGAIILDWVGGIVGIRILDFSGQFQRESEPAIGQIQSLLRGKLLDAVITAWSPARLGQPPGYILR